LLVHCVAITPGGCEHPDRHGGGCENHSAHKPWQEEGVNHHDRHQRGMLNSTGGDLHAAQLCHGVSLLLGELVPLTHPICHDARDHPESHPSLDLASVAFID
jgi:hypothetical protein